MILCLKMVRILVIRKCPVSTSVKDMYIYNKWLLEFSVTQVVASWGALSLLSYLNLPVIWDYAASCIWPHKSAGFRGKSALHSVFFPRSTSHFLGENNISAAKNKVYSCCTENYCAIIVKSFWATHFNRSNYKLLTMGFRFLFCSWEKVAYKNMQPGGGAN